MASLELRGERYRIVFRFDGRKFQHTLKTTEEGEAASCLARLEENLRLVERGRLVVPPGADLPTFLLSDGRLNEKPKFIKPVTLKELCDRYLETHRNGAMEANSLETVAMHLRHFIATFGEKFPLPTLTLTHLQQHVDRRSKKKGIRGKPLSPVTLRKEMTSLRAAWNWGALNGYVTGPFPNKGLKYPKSTDKPPFQTRIEIESQLKTAALGPAEERDLWDCLFLTLPEITELLAFVRTNAAHDWIYPMFCLAAHTGARRSEMRRARVCDVEFNNETILLHEKKRAKGRRTTRRVPLSPLVITALKDWLTQHPSGPFLFCQRVDVPRSRTNRSQPTPITRDEAHDHFHRTLAGSKWAVLRGWHVLRHSFASNLAAKGVDQRMIDE
jgi:integrase